MRDRVRLLWLLTLGLLLAMPGCGGAVKFVPYTPTPGPTPTPEATASSSPAGSIPTQIVAETIGLDAPVLEMGWRVAESWGNISSEWETPEHEAGWHRNSARPGEGGNIVISGHNNSIGVGVFGALEQLAAGDPIILHAGADAVYLYRVKETHIVRAFAPTQETVDFLTAAIAPTPHEQLTLITCWPSWSNTHRLVVIAEPASPP